MVKNYLSKLVFILLCCLVFWTVPVAASSDYSGLFITITDATTALENGEKEQATALVQGLKAEIAKLENIDSKAGKKVTAVLEERQELTKDQLVELTAALIAFDEEQHPIDVEAEKQKLISRLTPEYARFQEALDSKDIGQIKAAYKQLNTTWTVNEGIVRKDAAHYGRVETSISFLRSAIETEPVDMGLIQTNFDSMKSAVQDFIDGKDVAAVSSTASLADGIDLLKQALVAFEAEDDSKGSQLMKEFITLWPSIEGDISTRNPVLYNRVESETPIIMVKGGEASYQEDLTDLIAALSEIDTSASYNFVDASLILLREGLEAMLILLTLVTSLRAAKQRKGLKWVYAGAVAGVLGSVGLALVLQLAVPSLTSGANREMIEGFVGILAVLVMFLVGIWLHSKSSISKWNSYMNRQMKMATATGSFVSMFSLSFLAVFREGAETILFYVGILSRITTSQLLLGIALAVILLVVAAYIMLRMTSRFLAYQIFFWMTWLIYALAFKMLGVSIHALQLTAILPSHLIDGLPTLDWIGLYPTWEGVLPQMLFVLAVLLVSWKQRERS